MKSTTCPRCGHKLDDVHNDAGDLTTIPAGQMACYYNPPGAHNMGPNGRIKYCDCTYNGPGTTRYY